MHRNSLLLSLLVLIPACAGRTAASAAPPVRPGIEVLLTDSLQLLAGKRVGVLTNQTGVNREGVRDIDLLLDAGVQLTAIFSPEHGFSGTLDRQEISHGIDSPTGVPVFSLYGETRAPTRRMLDSLDLLLIDLQDIGTRTYTYASTMLLAMEAAGQYGVPVFILDRPNPIGGVSVQGPVLDDTLKSFIGMLRLPLRHGLTLGEIALMGRAMRGMRVEVHVIPAAGWKRAMWFDETGLPWIKPSPNMPDLESATHYPGIVVFESTNLSVGRGTPIAFQLIGSPWLDPRRVLELAGPQPGVQLSDTIFTPLEPTDGKYSGMALPGIRLRVMDRATYDPVRTGLKLLWAIHRAQGGLLEVRRPGLDRRIGTQRIWDMIEAGGDFRTIYRAVSQDLERFRARQRGEGGEGGEGQEGAFLLYR